MLSAISLLLSVTPPAFPCSPLPPQKCLELSSRLLESLGLHVPNYCVAQICVTVVAHILPYYLLTLFSLVLSFVKYYSENYIYTDELPKWMLDHTSEIVGSSRSGSGLISF